MTAREHARTAATLIASPPGSASPAEPLLRVRFCGGCNPAIDRGALAAAVAAALGGSGAGATLYVSGCARACASGRRLKVQDGAAVVVAGDQVDGRPTAAPSLVQAVTERFRAREPRPSLPRPSVRAVAKAEEWPAQSRAGLVRKAGSYGLGG
jgi:hypothetical protein